MNLYADAIRSQKVIFTLVRDNPASETSPAAAMLAWYGEMGVDEAIGHEAIDRFAESARLAEAKATRLAQRTANTAPEQPGQRTALNHAGQLQSGAQPPRPAPRQPAPATTMAIDDVEKLANGCTSLDELARALDGFDACPLKRTATQLCFADGLPGAHLMIIGDVPGREEDEEGRPFVGRQGQFLDKMLDRIGLHRNSEDRASSVFLSNMVFWRPPGGREPTAAEVAMCLPFVKRAIALAQPEVLLLLGAMPSQALLNSRQSITKLRGNWHKVDISGKAAAAMPMLNPDHITQSAQAKRTTWLDLLGVRKRLLETR